MKQSNQSIAFTAFIFGALAPWFLIWFFGEPHFDALFMTCKPQNFKNRDTQETYKGYFCIDD